MEISSVSCYEFGEFKIDPRRRVLTKKDTQIAISAKNFDLLLYLVQNEGQILTHEELLDEVWKGTFVEQSNLKKGISAIRQVLGEAPDSSLYIKTVPRRGYCFVCPVADISDKSIQVSATEIIIKEELIAEDEPANSTKLSQQLTRKTNSKQFNFLFLLFFSAAVILIAGICFWYLLRQTKVSQFSFLKIENLKPQKLSTNGNINVATLSGNGKFFVYALSESDGKQSLWLRQIGSMNAINLVPSSTFDFQSITVSNDNDSVFYGVADGNSKDTLFQIPILGGSPRKIIENISSSPTIFPDGKKIGFLRDVINGGRSLIIYNLETAKEESEVYKVNGDNHGIISPRLSPDGTKFAFITSDKNAEERTWVLNEIPFNGGSVRQIIPPRKGKIYDLKWLNDGSGIIMAADLNDSRQSQLWKVNITNGETQRLTNDLLDYTNVNLSNDGRSILTVQAERKADLWKLDFAKPNNPEQITKNLNLPNRFDISAEGRIVAEVFENARQTIALINPADSSAQQVLTQPSSDRSPSFSPDGKFIYYVSRNSGSDQIWRADSNGSNPTRLTDGKTFVINPVLAPNGEDIYFEKYNGNRWQAVKMPKDGGETVLLSDDTVSNFDISSDGKFLAYHYLDHQSNKWKIRVRNLSDGSIYKDFDLVGNSVIRFTPDNRSLIYNVSKVKADGGNLWIQPLNGGLPKPLIETQPDEIYWVRTSKDRKTLFYTQGKTTSSAVLLSLEIPK